MLMSNNDNEYSMPLINFIRGKEYLDLDKCKLDE